MEASVGAHLCARNLSAFGLEPRIIATQLVAPYRMQGTGGKNDAIDAAAMQVLGRVGDLLVTLERLLWVACDDLPSPDERQLFSEYREATLMVALATSSVNTS